MHSVIVVKDGSETITIYGLAGPRGASSDHPDYEKIKQAAIADKRVEVERLFTGAGIFLGNNYPLQPVKVSVQSVEVKPLKSTPVKGLTFVEPQVSPFAPEIQEFKKYLRLARARKRSPKFDIPYLAGKDGRNWQLKEGGDPAINTSWQVVSTNR